MPFTSARSGGDGQLPSSERGIASGSPRGNGPCPASRAFCTQRSGLFVPATAVETPGTDRVKRSALPIESSMA
ncbi:MULTISPECIES: hypothetical protein [unclassified Paenibacillus]|uniref:hypothetical protein n=1 Tax=unclassified Paenibacillus TaxID=185978 RepID=UPI000565F560|nr:MULTISPECIES: hypothetical protein [unclassified Paenibacillus]